MRWSLVVIAVAVVLAAVVLAVAPYLVGLPRVQALIAGQVARSLGRPVRFASVSASIFPRPALELRGLEVAEDPAFGAGPFLTLDKGRLHLRLGSLLRGRVELAELILTRPRIALVQTAEGRWNVASVGSGSETDARAGPRVRRPDGGSVAAPPPLLPVSRIRVEGGSVSWTDGGKPGPRRAEGLDLVVTPRRSSLAFEGRMTIQPGDLVVRVTEGQIGPGGTRGLGDAPLRARVTVEGEDVATLVPPGPKALAVSGPLRASLALSGTAGAPKASGPVEVAHLTLSRTDPACAGSPRRSLAAGPVTLAAAWEDWRLSVRPLRASLAEGTVEATLVAAPGQPLRVDVPGLTVRGVALQTLLADFLCQGYAVSGPLDLAGTLSFRTDDLLGSLAGSGRLRVGRGKVIGAQAQALLGTAVRVGGALSTVLGADFAAGQISPAPLDFDSITGTWRIAAGVVTSRDLLYTGPGMTVSVAGDYALASDRLDLDVVLRHRQGELRARVTGPAASPTVRPVGAARPVEPSLRDLLRKLR